MRLVDIILSSLQRRKGRAALLIIGLAIGVATVVALTATSHTLQADVADKIDEYGANIFIVPHSGDLALSYGGVTVGSTSFDLTKMTMDDVDRIQTIKNSQNLSTIAPKLLGAVEMGGRPVLMAGVRFDDEFRLKQWWEVRGEYPFEANEAVAGSRLAHALTLSAGDEVELDGHTVRIAGILNENGSQDDDILFVPLALAQEITGRPDAVSLVEVAALCSTCPIEELVEQISGVLPQARVTALRQAMVLRMETVGQLGRFAVAVSAVVVVIGALVVLTSMLGSVSERRQEIGLFRALGFRQRHVRQVILGEAALVSLTGGILGWLLGMGAAIVVMPMVTQVDIAVVWPPALPVAAIMGALMVGLAGSLYPAAQAARLDPTIALRSL
jgi:putative ABC transport system permease protein